MANGPLDNLLSSLSSLCAPPSITLSSSSLEASDPTILNRSLIMKLHSDVFARVPALRETLSAVWRQEGSFSLKDCGPFLFLATFAQQEDVTWVLRNGPWTYGGDFLLLQRCRPLTSFDSYRFPRVELFIHIHGIPFEFISRANIKDIVGKFGELLPSNDEDFTKWGRFVRAKVAIPVDAPLVGSIGLSLPSNPEHKLVIQYEKLERFCSFCGRLGHLSQGCKYLDELLAKIEDEDTPAHVRDLLRSINQVNFPPSLRAPPFTGRRSPTRRPSAEYRRPRPRAVGSDSEDGRRSAPPNHEETLQEVVFPNCPQPTVPLGQDLSPYHVSKLQTEPAPNHHPYPRPTTLSKNPILITSLSPDLLLALKQLFQPATLPSVTYPSNSLSQNISLCPFEPEPDPLASPTHPRPDASHPLTNTLSSYLSNPSPSGSRDALQTAYPSATRNCHLTARVSNLDPSSDRPASYLSTTPLPHHTGALPCPLLALKHHRIPPGSHHNVGTAESLPTTPSCWQHDELLLPPPVATSPAPDPPPLNILPLWYGRATTTSTDGAIHSLFGGVRL